MLLSQLDNNWLVRTSLKLVFTFNCIYNFTKLSYYIFTVSANKILRRLRHYHNFIQKIHSKSASGAWTTWRNWDIKILVKNTTLFNISPAPEDSWDKIWISHETNLICFFLLYSIGLEPNIRGPGILCNQKWLYNYINTTTFTTSPSTFILFCLILESILMMELFCSTETAKVPFRAHPEFEIWKLLHLLILKFIVFECNQS